jgi:hypothetical protein
VAAFVSKRDCELACDEAVLQQLGESERLNYGKTLVDMVATNPTAANLLETATAMHETKKALKERVNHIVKKKKHLLISALCLILVLSIVTGCSFAGKKDSTPTTDPSDSAGTTEPGGTTEPLQGPSPENPSKGLYYRVNLDGKTCTVISSGTCVDKEFYVPSVIDGYTVTAIGDGAFEFFEWAEYIYLPDTVTAIGERAFYACGKVTEIRLPSGLQSVGGDAFRECGNLKALELPQNVEVIGDFTVRGCNKLEKLTIPETVTYLQESTVTSDLLTSIVIPSSVTRMDKDAFAYCDVLTTVIYQGTVAQWQAVEKHVQWCLHSNFFVIQCADGYVHAVTGEIVDTP